MRGVLRWAWDFVLGRDTGLDDFELSFPEILNFVPLELHQMVVRGLGSPSARKQIPSSGKHDVVILGIIDFECRFQRPQVLDLVSQSSDRCPPGWHGRTSSTTPASQEPSRQPDVHRKCSHA